MQFQGKFHTKCEIVNTANESYDVFDGNLRFDFFLSKYNLLIECDGPQHYKLIQGMYTKEEFCDLLEHDRRKNEWCQMNGIKLLRLIEKDFGDVIARLVNELESKLGEL